VTASAGLFEAIGTVCLRAGLTHRARPAPHGHPQNGKVEDER
jgi:hypothetical protein